MKKLYSLIRACMTSDMSLFRFKTNKNNKLSILLPLFISGYLMYMIWNLSNSLFEKLSPLNLSYLLLSLFVLSISIMTFIEGIYKSGPLVFNCKDDQLLLSLPIKRSTVLFVRIFKFYLFELLFNSLFLLPIMVSYISWDSNLSWTYFLTSFIMLLLLPIIPIVLSCILGFTTSSLSSKFKYKNAAQIIISMCVLVGVLALSFNMDGILEYIIKNSSNINELVTKIYYPAGIYAKLVNDFSIVDLLIFVMVHVCVFAISIVILSKFYFKINTRLKSVSSTSKRVSIDSLTIKSKSVTRSLVKKEMSTFFKTPVFIINAGFSLVLFLIAVIVIALKHDTIMPLLIAQLSALDLKEEIIMNNIPIIILILISFASYMTSITNSIISLEGRNITILKSLPIKTKTILIGKILACLKITTPVLFIGDIILFIVLKISVIDSLLLLILSILIPLVSHFIGLIVNLKYPNLNWENSAEVVKQSTSSFISVMLGMALFVLTSMVIFNVIGKISGTLLLIIVTVIYILIDIILYIYLLRRGTIDFNNLTI